MKKFRGKDIAVFVLGLGILAAGAYFLMGSGSFISTPAAASMTPEALTAENEMLMKQVYDASMQLQMIAYGGSEPAKVWVEKYCKDGRAAPLPEAPEAANAELKARAHDARIIFEGLQADQREEIRWLTQYYGEENEETLKKLGIKSKKAQAQEEELARKEEGIASKIVSALRSTKAALILYYADHLDEIGQQKNYDLGAVLDTPEHIQATLGVYVEGAIDYSDGRWIFRSEGDRWWIGYKLEGISEANRQRLVQKARVTGLFKAPDSNKNSYDGGDYDGGDVVFMIAR